MDHAVTNESLHGRIALGILMAAQSLGIDMRAVAAQVGLDLPALAADPDATVPIATAAELWRELERRSNDPLIGLAIASRLPLGVLGFVYHSLHVSDRLRDAMHRGARYQRLLAGPLRTVVTERGHEVVLAIDTQRWRDIIPFAVEQHIVVMTMRALASCVGGTLTPLRVAFTRPWSGDMRRFVEIFGDVPIHFGEPRPALVLSREDLERPVPSADPTMARWLDVQGEQRLEAHASDDVIARMRGAIQVALGRGEPRLEDVAHLLSMSARTLQRRLQDEQTKFASEVDVVRRELALRLMNERARATADVAFLVGYSELSAFYRAFRRWTGATPAEWRKTRMAAAH